MNLPGSQNHQTILAALIDLFKGDDNIKAFGYFGSLARGDWDNFSDLDLDVIVANDSKPTVEKYLISISGILHTKNLDPLSSFEEDVNEWVLILSTLDRISLRFHLLNSTSPNILNSFVILSGNMSLADIKRALPQIKTKPTSLNLLQHKFLEHSIYVPIYLHRNELLNAFNMLNILRNTLITIYYKSHSLSKIEKFEKHAPKDIIEKLKSTYSNLDSNQIRAAFENLIKLYINSINSLSNGKLSLSPKELEILNKALLF